MNMRINAFSLCSRISFLPALEDCFQSKSNRLTSGACYCSLLLASSVSNPTRTEEIWSKKCRTLQANVVKPTCDGIKMTKLRVNNEMETQQDP